MKKRKGWLWTLGAAIAFAISTVMTLTSPIYDDKMNWWFPAALAVVFAALTVWLRSKAKAAEAEETRRKQAIIQAQEEEAHRKQEMLQEEQKKREEHENRLRASRERYVHERFAVAGVTFKNEDKSDRQQILREIALNEGGSCAVTLEEDTDKGEDSAIKVMTEFGCVGYIRRNDKASVRRFFDKQVNTMVLSVERFENDDGEKIYRADVVIGMDKEDPEQQWYFDDLSKS